VMSAEYWCLVKVDKIRVFASRDDDLFFLS